MPTTQLYRILAVLVPLLLVATPAQAGGFGFPDQVTVWGAQVDFIYQVLMWISIAILVFVEVALVAAIVKFRQKPGDTRKPATWTHNTQLEIAWTAIPFLLLVAVLFPTFKSLAYLADVPTKPDITLEVIGHQFFWEYRYPELGVTLNTNPTMEDHPIPDAEVLHIPMGKRMKVIITATDVIHGWWVPAFGVQQMATPATLAVIPLEVTKPGTFDGACTYLCGALHGDMRIKVKTESYEEFMAWANKREKVASMPKIEEVGKVGMVPKPPVKPGHGGPAHGSPAPTHPVAAVDAKVLAAQGEKLYASKCIGCHQAGGVGMGDMFPPLAGSEYVNGDDAKLLDIIKNGISGKITVKGKEYNGAMPPQDVTDEEAKAIATFLRMNWGNNGKAVGAQPELPDTHAAAHETPSTGATAATDANKDAASAEVGRKIYTSKCVGCHQASGAGMGDMFPPLAGSEYVNGDDAKLLDIIKNGISGKITVKGKEYNGAMPPQQLSDEEAIAVANYIRNQWGNSGKPVKAAH